MIIIGTPHTKGAGYYKNDDTASGGKKSEADIRTCTHCQAVIKMQAWKEDGGFLWQVYGPDLFVHCADKMQTRGCEPFMQQIEKAFIPRTSTASSQV
jgi:hypothetical protein